MNDKIHYLSTNWAKIHVYSDRIILEKIDEVRLLGGDVSSQKTILIKDIKTIHYREPSFMRTGFIQFAVGASEQEATENTFYFNSDKLKFARRIKDTVERLTSESNSTSKSEAASNADEIKKFKQLLDDGAITMDEYQEKKRQLLNL